MMWELSIDNILVAKDRYKDEKEEGDNKEED